MCPMGVPSSLKEGRQNSYEAPTTAISCRKDGEPKSLVLIKNEYLGFELNKM